MDGAAIVTEYLRLGLRFGRLVNGLLDSYTGDPALRRQVDNEVRPHPQHLVNQARHLREELANTPLSAQRRRFLAIQLQALECTGRRLCGEPLPFRARIEASFQVRVSRGDPEEYRQAHAELDTILPGSGTLAARIAAMRARDTLSPDQLEPCVEALSSALRECVRRNFGLPAQESVEYRTVTDKPWTAFNQYLGDYRSRVLINVSNTRRAATLPHLVAHESYPGHHTERCRKESNILGQGDRDERNISLVNTPQCLMSEGLADLGLYAVVGPEWGRWSAAILAEQQVPIEGELADRTDAPMRKLRAVRQDAMLMLHDEHADETAVIEYLQRWLLVPELKAREFVRFLADPFWDAYTTTYVEGYRLLRRWWEARPTDSTAVGRFRRLLDEPLTPEILREELAHQLE